jgi:hypothetical protein
MAPRAEGARADLIFMRERYFAMLKTDLIMRNPVQLLSGHAEDLLSAGQFGGVLARAGVGKTALMVQIALNAMLHERNVLHISLNQPVNKTGLWYREVFTRIAGHQTAQQLDPLWESLLPHRFIMTFRAEGFSVSKLDERLSDLVEQSIFIPRLLIVDGLSFDGPDRDQLVQLKTLAARQNLSAWFSIRTHRHEDPAPGGIPPQLAPVEDLFEAAIQLVPTGEDVHVVPLKGVRLPAECPRLVLDPTTMLVKGGE